MTWTGAGKSTTVAGLLAALSDHQRYPSARVVVLDIHGEYARALRDRSTVFRVDASEPDGERPLCVPFWALNFDEFRRVAFGAVNDAQAASIGDFVVSLKRESLAAKALPGITSETLTADSPVPFCVHKMWLELTRKELQTVVPKPGGAADEREPAYVLAPDGTPVQSGDAMTVTPPQFRTIKTTGAPADRVQHANEGIGIRQQLATLAAKLRDPRFAFMFRPGDWLPSLTGTTQADLDSLLFDWIGGPNPISVLDLSGIPAAVLDDLIGALLRILYDALFWARKLPEGGRERPLLVVLEEAHAYLGSAPESSATSGAAASAVRRIAKEGRKYGVGIMLVSQRPSEIDPTILAQCGTLFAMRLANDRDRGHVTAAASDNLKGLFDMLPILRTGEAIIVGEAVSLPVRTLIDAPAKERRPDSEDPRVVVRGSLQGDGFEGPGGWNQKRDHPDYAAVVRHWRRQNPRYEHQQGGPTGPKGADQT
jgi:hypothetical protein